MQVNFGGSEPTTPNPTLPATPPTTVVTEPTSFGMLALCALGFAYSRRRKA